MDKNRLLLGKLLGEIYRTQSALKIRKADDATVFGLLNAIEETIESEIGTGVSNEQLKLVFDVLSKYSEPDNLATVRGHDLQGALRGKGLDDGTAHTAVLHFRLQGDFKDLLDKMTQLQDTPDHLRILDRFEKDAF